MKAIIEKRLEGSLTNIQKYLSFNDILQAMELSDNKSDLIKRMRELNHVTNYFIFGFGIYHMWVHEVDKETNKTNQKRLLTVEF